jgi:hypothetical protein
MVKDPADYRHCSWGEFSGTGRHPWHANFTRHLRRVRGTLADGWDDARIFAEFRGELAAEIAWDQGGPGTDVQAVREAGKASPPVTMTLCRRIRHFSDGVAIGQQSFVRAIYGRFFDASKALTRRYGTVRLRDRAALASMRSPRPVEA